MQKYDGLSSVELYRMGDEAQATYHELRRAARLAQKAEEESRRPAEPRPTPDLPEFILFARYTGGRVYHYAAVGWNVGGQVRWAVTGTEARRFNWPGLLEFIGEANWSTLQHVTNVEPLVAPGAEPPAAETVGSFGQIKRHGPVDPFAH